MDKGNIVVKILLCGVGGYGAIYSNTLLDNSSDRYKVVGIVDPMAKSYKRIKEFIENGAVIYNSMEECYTYNDIDLCIISSPIQFHAEQSIFAMEHGSNVLCEKPIAGCLDDADRMIKTSKRTGKVLAIGYQWSFVRPIIDLKTDILDGVYGKVISMKYMTLWKRSERYFKRNKWAGKIKDQRGKYINDSVLQNATAHHLHNLLFLAGKSMNESLEIIDAEYEAYKANDIETYDTVFARFKGSNCETVFAAASHAVTDSYGPIFEIETTNGKIVYKNDGILRGELKSGEKKEYGLLEIENIADGEMKKLFACIDNIIYGEAIPCTASTSISHLTCISMIDEYNRFNEKLIKQTNEAPVVHYVEGLEEIAQECYDKMSLPRELGITLS